MRALVCCLALLLLLPECGGSPAGASPNSAADDDKSAPAPRASAKAGGSGASEDSEEHESSRGPSCDDGTCSLCGSGICPVGWYCDEKAGGACSWLAECAEKPSCGCITRVLGASCKCDAAGGGLKVACD
jgi:hypothetical protein